MISQKESSTMSEKVSLTEVIAHVKKMRVLADDSTAKCVDGGYKEMEAVGALAIPGGHLGVSMVLLKLGYFPQEAFQLVYDFVMEKEGKYGWHTDTHEGHHGVKSGCGHCNAAITQEQKYNIDSKKIEALLEIIKAKQATANEQMEFIILDREHQEQAILVVTGTTYTVKPWDETENHQYFIYDQARHQAFLQEFAQYLQNLNHQTSYEDLLQVSDEQTNLTLGLLASSQGKPMYSVNADNEVPEVNYLQNAPIL
ncbi:MAG: hypothetical protein A2383_00780 [Candidatus Pacebacteria bacterium RIFOXYB1_FULL_39_46]|nr:MAG: hypothetical protein A2182_00615 [Candidatus Pacebacteria bacterium RIFOXYA1_FULL_38_18]OGJ38121.1 MAG: hypothetical protein A2383_00780 [Candidatus Pacebacteria bacterium RIFOXYB1_FULL_39_46]OGJ39657.1 MAG: hypothetical protein A2411_02660 [Candidatus Pacebacteria bacterium RIFOXYC1_FULL_39_21]OGJ39873.1 MAG: hypothetical protein A2582_00545 [Candidatus Pacebacteria bacterium RIFOXYD1_FULL_39_27]